MAHRRGLVVLMLILLAFVACTGSGDLDGVDTAPTDTTSDLIVAVEGVCAAREEASDSAERAASIFLDRSHVGIHRLADEVSAIDRAIATRVLEAKQAIETAAGEGDDRGLREALSRLAVEAGDALRALGLDAPPCTRRGG